jgi:predicted transcriptional regulator
MPRSVAARLAGVDDSYWGRLERGECDPTLTSLLRIQRGFGLDSIETLLGPTASTRLAADLADGPIGTEQNA